MTNIMIIVIVTLRNNQNLYFDEVRYTTNKQHNREIDLISKQRNGVYIAHSPEFGVVKRDRELDKALQAVVYECSYRFHHGGSKRKDAKTVIYCKSIQLLNRVGVYRFGTHCTYILE